MGNNDTTGGLLGGGFGGGLMNRMLPNDPRQQAWNQAAFALLATPGNIAQKIGGAGLAGLSGYQSAQQNQLLQKYREMQMQQMQSQMEEQERERKLQEQVRNAALGSVVQPSAIPATAMDYENSFDTGNSAPQMRPGGFDQKGFIDRLYQIDPLKAISMQQQLAPKTDYKVVGNNLVGIGPDGVKPVYEAPTKEATPTNIREYEYAVRQGYRGSFDQWSKDQKRAGASSTNVNVNTEKTFGKTLAEGLGKQVDDSFSAAKGAVSAINTATRLREAVDSGKIMAGPGTSFRVAGLQLGQMLGIGGKDSAEVLSNTRNAIQAMAQAELDAAQQMKGQGQITEAERSIIRRAASGDIDSLTGPEIKLLANTMDKIGRAKISQHRRNVEGLRSVPGAEVLLPFYQLEEPPMYQQQPSGSPAAVRRFNPETGKIE